MKKEKRRYAFNFYNNYLRKRSVHVMLKYKKYYTKFSVEINRPEECSDCQLIKIKKTQLYQISNDFDESYFFCKILKRKIWGENPKCTKEDWQKYFASGNEKIEKFKEKMYSMGADKYYKKQQKNINKNKK